MAMDHRSIRNLMSIEISELDDIPRPRRSNWRQSRIQCQRARRSRSTFELRHPRWIELSELDGIPSPKARFKIRRQSRIHPSVLGDRVPPVRSLAEVSNLH